MEKCEICNKEFKGNRGMALHLSNSHNTTLLDYYVKYKGLKVPTCPFCHDEVPLRKGIKFNTTCGKKECLSKQSKSLVFSPEVLEFLSKHQSEVLSKKEHNWTISTISIPCEHLKVLLLKAGLAFREELKPLTIKNYRIDIAFPEEKIGLEVNGNQHYKSHDLSFEQLVKLNAEEVEIAKELAPYYQERKEAIESEDWILIDIHYSFVYKPEFVNDLIKQLKEQLKERTGFNLDTNFSYGKEKAVKHCKDCDKILPNDNRKGLCPECAAIRSRKTPRPPYDELMDEIDKYGYKGTGERHGVSDNTIRDWKEKYEKDK